MDPYRARTIARFSGLAVLIVCGIILAMMQKTLVSMKAERKGEGLPLPGPGDGGARVVNRGPELGTSASRAARELLGPAAVVQAASDVDGDGGFETLALVPVTGAPSGVVWARRVGVLAASRSGGYALLFDSARASDLPQPDAAGVRFRIWSLDLRRLVLEPLAPDGVPIGPPWVVTWDAAQGRYASAQDASALDAPAGRTGPPAVPSPAALSVER